MEYSKCLAGIAVAIVSAIFISRSAPGFTVQELGVSPGETASISITDFYTGDVSVGLLKLVVNGVAADGFCIDPFHFSLSSSAGYQFRSLADAPRPPGGPMGSFKADEISKLWAMDYSPTMSGNQAAGLQLAIWEIVGGNRFSVIGNDYGAGILLQNLADFTGPGTSLIALSGPGQDYVIPTPEGGSTLAFLAMAAAGLASVHLVARSSRLSASEHRS